MKRFCRSLWSHLNVLTFFPPDGGMLRKSRCVPISIFKLLSLNVRHVQFYAVNMMYSSTYIIARVWINWITLVYPPSYFFFTFNQNIIHFVPVARVSYYHNVFFFKLIYAYLISLLLPTPLTPHHAATKIKYIVSYTPTYIVDTRYKNIYYILLVEFFANLTIQN